jgi:hypothetical protein
VISLPKVDSLLAFECNGKLKRFVQSRRDSMKKPSELAYNTVAMSA